MVGGKIMVESPKSVLLENISRVNWWNQQVNYKIVSKIQCWNTRDLGLWESKGGHLYQNQHILFISQRLKWRSYITLGRNPKTILWTSCKWQVFARSIIFGFTNEKRTTSLLVRSTKMEVQELDYCSCCEELRCVLV